MRPLDLNLASRPYHNNTLVWLAYLGLLVAAMGLTYWNVSSFRHYRQELTELDRVQGNMEQEQDDLESRHRKILRGIKNFDRVAIGRRTSKANEVIEWRAFSWTRLFNRLENVLPSNIKMTSVRPIFRSRDREAEEADPRPSMPVKVEGLARDWDALFELQTDLIENTSFGRVLPRNIDKLPNGELAFSIEFTYYPDEPTAAEESAVIEEVAEAAVVEPSSTQAADEPANDDAGRRKLPATADERAEVTDEWAGTTDAQPAKRSDARQPGRRTLPKVEPDADTADDEGELR